jgi:pimeloyl-ACP methyl ester carboxylesterase
VHLLGDSRHRWANPTLYKRDEAEACWRAIEAPMLLVVGEKSDFRTRLGRDGTDEALRALVRRIEIASIANAGHMMHIERPESLAPLIESFLRMHR